MASADPGQPTLAARSTRASSSSLGLVLVVGGLVLVPLPGPGWLIVILGIAVWASEFEPAARLLDFVKDEGAGVGAVAAAAGRGGSRRSWRSATALFVACALWLTCGLTGVPGLLPDSGSRTGSHANAGL